MTGGKPFAYKSHSSTASTIGLQSLFGQPKIRIEPWLHSLQPLPLHCGHSISIGSRSVPSSLHCLLEHPRQSFPCRINAASLIIFFRRRSFVGLSRISAATLCTRRRSKDPRSILSRTASVHFASLLSNRKDNPASDRKLPRLKRHP